MSDNSITVVGNATRDPELKFLNSGTASVRLSVAVNRRWQNRQTQEWEERVSFFEVVAFGHIAENAANSLTKGVRVVVTGRLEQRSWQDEQGDKHSIVEINADEIAPSLRFATALVTRTPRPEAPGRPVATPAGYRPPADTSGYGHDEEPF